MAVATRTALVRVARAQCHGRLVAVGKPCCVYNRNRRAGVVFWRCVSCERLKVKLCFMHDRYLGCDEVYADLHKFFERSSDVLLSSDSFDRVSVRRDTNHTLFVLVEDN